jgi:hypothetical protein
MSPKQWRLASKAKGFDSASLLGSSQAETNLTDNLDQLRKIRKQRKDVYDKERPKIYKMMDTSVNGCSTAMRQSNDLYASF